MPTALQAIAESTTLRALLARIDQSKACLDIVLQGLPLGLHTSIAAGPLTDTEWCLLIRNASAVTKLKQLEPTMLAALQAKGFAIKSIRFKRQFD